MHEAGYSNLLLGIDNGIRMSILFTGNPEDCECPESTFEFGEIKQLNVT